MSKHSRSKRAIQQGKDAVQPANETEGLEQEQSFIAEQELKKFNKNEKHIHG